MFLSTLSSRRRLGGVVIPTFTEGLKTIPGRIGSFLSKLASKAADAISSTFSRRKPLLPAQPEPVRPWTEKYWKAYQPSRDIYGALQGDAPRTGARTPIWEPYLGDDEDPDHHDTEVFSRRFHQD